MKLHGDEHSSILVQFRLQVRYRFRFLLQHVEGAEAADVRKMSYHTTSKEKWHARAILPMSNSCRGVPPTQRQLQSDTEMPTWEIPYVVLMVLRAFLRRECGRSGGPVFKRVIVDIFRAVTSNVPHGDSADTRTATPPPDRETNCHSMQSFCPRYPSGLVQCSPPRSAKAGCRVFQQTQSEFL